MSRRNLSLAGCCGAAWRRMVLGAMCMIPISMTCKATDYIDVGSKSNMVSNPGFEYSSTSGARPLQWSVHVPGSNTLGWSWSYVNDASLAHRGRRCLKFSNVYSRGNWADRLYTLSDPFSIDAASRYIFRVWYRTEGAGDGAVIIRVRYLDAAGSEIYSDQTGVESTAGAWRPADLFLHPADETARARAVQASVQVYFDHSPGTLWVDDIGVFKLEAAEIPAVYPFGRFCPPNLATNGGLPFFAPGAVSVRQADGAWWMVKNNGEPFYWNTVNAGEPSENMALTNYLWTVRRLTPQQYAADVAVRLRKDLLFNAGYKPDVAASTELATDWLNFSTEVSIPGSDWILKDAQGVLFGSSGHWFPDPFSPAWQSRVVAEAGTIDASFVGRSDAVGYWTDNEWVYGPMSDFFWSDNCKTALVAWLQGTLDVPAGFQLLHPYANVKDLNSAWSSAYHTYAYGSFEEVYGSDKPRVRAFDDPVSSNLLAFERVVFKTYADTVIGAVRRREDKLIGELAAQGRAGYRHMIMSCRVAFEGPGYAADALRRNMDVFRDFDVIAINAYPFYRNGADHYPRSYVEALRRTFYDTTGRPVLISEYGIAARDAGVPVARWHDRTVESQAERGAGYHNLSAVFANLPWVVGQSWFKWYNGYGVPEGKDPRNCGIVDDHDAYYAALTNRIVGTNLRLNSVRRRGDFTLSDIDWRPLALPVYEGVPPGMDVTQPSGNGATGTVSTVIRWAAADPDSPATIVLYASTNAATAANGVPIAEGLTAGVDTQFVWDVQSQPPGKYWIVASVDDGSGPPRWAQSLGPVVLDGMADEDSDGMPNSWELIHFGSKTGADPAADPDGDRMPNLEEFKNGTDPNAASGGKWPAPPTRMRVMTDSPDTGTH